MVSTRDRNLGKVVVLLPVVVGVLGVGVSSLLTAVGLARSRLLAIVGFLTTAYTVARYLVTSSRSVGAAGSVGRFLGERCGGAALVTGCTSGLGLAWVEGLAAKKDVVHTIVAASRSSAKLEDLARRLARDGLTVVPVAVDFLGASKDFYETTVPALIRDHGVGLVVNNVGLGTEDPLPLSDLTTADIDDMITVNCGATTKMARAAVFAFSGKGGGKKRTGGVVVNVSSGSAAQPTPYLTVYAATKAYITHFSRSLHREMRAENTNVTVLAAQPYYISGTGLFKATRPSFNAPAASTVVDGTLRDLARRPTADLSHTSPGHRFIHFLFVNIAEDPVLGPIGLRLSRYLGFNGSMLMVMTKARARFLAKRDHKKQT